MKSGIKKLNIAVVDDHNLFRKGLIKLIMLGDVKNKYNILFEAENGHDLKENMTQPPFPDIILMDIDMPEADGFESVEWLQRTHSGIKVLVISMVETETSILRMLRMGVKGYLSKDIEVEDMHMALETITNNGLYYSDSVADVLNKNLNNPEKKDSASISLSENEREFLRLAATELTYQQIADKMHLSVKTIDGYRDDLFKRFNVNKRVTLVLYAVKHGIVLL